MRRSRLRAKRVWRTSLILFVAGLILFLWSAEKPLKAVSISVAEIIRLPLIAVSFVDQKVTACWSVIQGLIDLHRHNQELREELLKLKIERNSLKEMVVAVERYQALFEFQQRCPYITLIAQVIGRDPTNWYRSLVIAKGEQDGVIAGMGVITPLGVVGRVLKVNRTFSIVQLILNRDSVITALVQRTRDEGIVQGTEDGQAMMKYLPPLSSVETGDVVVTSGLDEQFPKGMVIGIVGQVEKKITTPFKSATLTLHADFSGLEEVIVLLGTTPSDQDDGECYGGGSRDREGGAERIG